MPANVEVPSSGAPRPAGRAALLEENALHFGQSLLAGTLVANAVSFTRPRQKRLDSCTFSGDTSPSVDSAAAIESGVG
jgi:hypothetical protein